MFCIPFIYIIFVYFIYTLLIYIFMYIFYIYSSYISFIHIFYLIFIFNIYSSQYLICYIAHIYRIFFYIIYKTCLIYKQTYKKYNIMTKLGVLLVDLIFICLSIKLKFNLLSKYIVHIFRICYVSLLIILYIKLNIYILVMVL